MNKPNILVVDDEKDITELLKLILQEAGYNVFTASNGISAVERTKSTQFSAVIADIMMPDMDGFELLNNLHQSEATKNIPVIMLTQKDEFEDINKAYTLGASHYVAKPFTAEDILRAVSKFIQS